MENKEEDYTTNEAKFQRILNKYPNISNASIYATQIKIASKEYVNYLNSFVDFKEVINVNNGINKSDTFAIKRGKKFEVNNKFVQKCIKEAYNKGNFLLFSFIKVNIVLDKLEKALDKR